MTEPQLIIRHWAATLLSFHRTPVFARMSLIVLGMGLYALFLAVIDDLAGDELINLHANLSALLGLVLGMLLVFRTNTAYDRWWEGRKLWGALMNDSRNFSIKTMTLVDAERSERERLCGWIIRFAFALKDHLRKRAVLRNYPEFADETAEPRHVPAYIARRVYQQFDAWRAADKLNGFEALLLDRHAAALMDICGACERIRNTRLSTSYLQFIRQSIGLYLLSLPWGLIDDFGYWTVPASMMVAYFMAGVELIAEDIEEPFGTSVDDIGLDGICEALERSVGEIVAMA